MDMMRRETTKRPRSSSSVHSAHPPCNRQKIEPISSPELTPSKYNAPDRIPVSESDLYAMNVEPHGESKVRDEDLTHIAVAAETSGLWVGPMDPRYFLEMFLPQTVDETARPNFQAETFSAVLSNASNESEMLGPFVEALSPFAPQLKLVATNSFPDTSYFRDGSEVGVSAYPVTESNTTKTDFSRMEIAIGLFFKEKHDPFCDSTEIYENDNPSRFPFERSGFKYEVRRGQIGSYLSALARAQFRLHFFAVCICGKWARLIRWDHNGAIVTKRFAYAEEDHLVEFFWRYSTTLPDDPIRGNDSTVKAPLPEDTIHTLEETAARTVLKEANHIDHREFHIMMIPDRVTDKEYRFLISYPPKNDSRSPFGRGTRSTLAFDLDKNMMVFVKDYWRSVVGDTEKEGDIYQLLHAADVPHIPPFGKGDDVRDHITLTGIVKTENWALPSAEMSSLRHYRMSLEEIGRPSNEFKSSYELVTAVADAMEAHEVAFREVNILHRDISAGNILITRDGRGILIDWDMCLNLNNRQGKMRTPRRTGTWQFLSASLLDDDKHIHDTLDDAESAFYVILWNMIKYTPPNRTDGFSWNTELFDGTSGVTCASFKRDFLCCKNRSISFEGRPHLNNLLWELSALLYTRYERPIGPFLRKFLETEDAAKESPLNYVLRERRLGERSWFVRTIRKHLEAKSEWPQADGPYSSPGRALSILSE